MTKTKKRLLCCMALFLVLCIISSVGASIVQSSNGDVIVEDVRIETDTGTLSMLIYRPAYASADEQVPCVVASHGIYNSREMQETALVELSRRGVAVVSIDMYGHGHSSSVLLTDPIDYIEAAEGYLAFDESGEAYYTEDKTDPNVKSWNSMGMVDAVNYVYDELDYVNKDFIGVMGHSYGAQNSNYATQYNYYQSVYGNGINKISGALLVANTPSFEYAEYSLADVGMIVGSYDEFFQANTNEQLPTTSDVVQYVAQMFFYARTGDEAYNSYEKLYEFGSYVDTVNLYSGEEHSYVFWMPSETHPKNVFSTETTGYVVEFWQHTFGEEMSDLSAGDQVWQGKAALNGLGLIGFFGFLLTLVLFLAELCKKRLLGKEESVAPALPALQKSSDWIVFLIGLALLTAMPGITFFEFMAAGESMVPSSAIWPQVVPNQVAWWAFLNGVIALTLLLVIWLATRKKSGAKLSDYGIKLQGKKLLSIAAFIVIPVVGLAAAYGLVWLSDAALHTDYRFFTLAVKTFRPQVLYCLVTLSVFYLVWSFANNIAVNSNFRHGMPEWLGYVFAIAGNVLGVIVLAMVYYLPLLSNGVANYGESMYPIQLYALFVTLPLAAVNARFCYKKTGSVYLGTVLNALLLCLISAANSYTLF